MQYAKHLGFIPFCGTDTPNDTSRERSLVEIKIIRSKRKTISIQLIDHTHLVVRSPLCLADADIARYLTAKSSWISKTRSKFQNQVSSSAQPYTGVELESFRNDAEIDIRNRIAYFAPLIGVQYHSASFGFQVSRWGSCSSNGNLRFNALLMDSPSHVRDYVVVHELCHLKHMNHSKAFWNEVHCALPGYKESQKWLKEQGAVLIARLRQAK